MAAGGGRVRLANADGAHVSGIRLRPLRMTQSRRAMLVAGWLAFLLAALVQPCCHGWAAMLFQAPGAATGHTHTVGGTGARDTRDSSHRASDCPDLLEYSIVAHQLDHVVPDTLQPPNFAIPATAEFFPAARWIAVERKRASNRPRAVSAVYLRTSRLLI